DVVAETSGLTPRHLAADRLDLCRQRDYAVVLEEPANEGPVGLDEAPDYIERAVEARTQDHVPRGTGGLEVVRIHVEARLSRQHRELLGLHRDDLRHDTGGTLRPPVPAKLLPHARLDLVDVADHPPACSTSRASHDQQSDNGNRPREVLP